MGCCGKKVKQIVTGYTNLIRQKTTKEAKSRLVICRNCASNRWKGMRMWCKECGCYIPAKIRAPKAECNLGKW